MAYTFEDAQREVGDSTDWSVGLEASIKKWEQRVEGDVNSYGRSTDCGLCLVAYNKAAPCADCPCAICGSLSDYSDEGVLQILKGLREEVVQNGSHE